MVTVPRSSQDLGLSPGSSDTFSQPGIELVLLVYVHST